MSNKNISQEFRLKNKDEKTNYLIEETNQNGLMSKKHKKSCTTPNSIEHFLILAFTITPRGLRSSNDVSFRSHISRGIAKHAETSTRLRN